MSFDGYCSLSIIRSLNIALRMIYILTREVIDIDSAGCHVSTTNLNGSLFVTHVTSLSSMIFLSVFIIWLGLSVTHLIIRLNGKLFFRHLLFQILDAVLIRSWLIRCEQ